MNSSPETPPPVLRIPQSLTRAQCAEELRQVLQDFAQGLAGDCMLDLSEVDYLGSSPIALFMTFVLQVRDRGGATTIRASSRDVLRALRLTRMDRLATLEQVAPPEDAA